MKSLIASALFGYVTAISHIEFSFLNYITEFGKSYDTVEEFEMRLSNFAATDEFIQMKNA